ncbi:hypothetical protein HAP94_25290, partial [Acidithiobacillus ferrivorans]|nr:hypothetical protein [Acidithiobacillus ferrivorans]
MQISLAKHEEGNQDLSGMEALHQDFQRLEHRIFTLSRHRFATYGLTTLSIVSGLFFFLLALSDTLPGPLRHVITHIAGHSVTLMFLSLTVLLVGLGMGVAKFSPGYMVVGVGTSIILYFGSQVIDSVIAPTHQPASCSGSAIRNSSACTFQGTKGHPYPAEYVQAQRIAFTIDQHKPVTAARRVEIGHDLVWINAHFPAISSHQFYQLDVAAYGHPTFPRAQAYAQSIVSAKAAHETAY